MLLLSFPLCVVWVHSHIGAWGSSATLCLLLYCLAYWSCCSCSLFLTSVMSMGCVGVLPLIILCGLPYRISVGLGKSYLFPLLAIVSTSSHFLFNCLDCSLSVSMWLWIVWGTCNVLSVPLFAELCEISSVEWGAL